jgi:sugar (pentulose or hexulose) kinase
VTCSTKIRLRKATTITDMYAALDLGQRTIRAVLKSQDGKIVNELKIKQHSIFWIDDGSFIINKMCKSLISISKNGHITIL